MDILYNRTQPIRLCTAGEKEADISTADDYKVLELSHFISWGMDLLQDESVPFGTALATVLYVGLKSEIPFKQNDFKTIDSIILQAPEIQAEFLQAKQELDTEETGQAAWRFILGVIEAFCNICSQKVKNPKLEAILWKPEMFGQSNEERRNYIYPRWQESQKNKKRKVLFAQICSCLSFALFLQYSCVTVFI